MFFSPSAVAELPGAFAQWQKVGAVGVPKVDDFHFRQRSEKSLHILISSGGHVRVAEAKRGLVCVSTLFGETIPVARRIFRAPGVMV